MRVRWAVAAAPCQVVDTNETPRLRRLGSGPDHERTVRSRLWHLSRDIFVQDIPEGVTSADQIPDDWMPEPLPFGHAEVLAAVTHLVPDADTSDPEWIHLALPGVDVEVNVATKSPLMSFALHVRATDRAAADRIISGLLDQLSVRAFDSESDTGIFHA